MRTAILSIARKNGKTALIAALCLAHLIGPEAIPNNEIYSAANDREQAAQVFKMARQIVELDPELNAEDGGLITIVPSTKTLVCKSNGSFYRAISSEGKTKHGFNPSVVIYDELAQSTNRELFDVLDTSFGARDEPLMIIISTQSPDPEHILSKLIDDGLTSNDPTIVCHLYAVNDNVPEEDIFHEEHWYAANPALGDFRSLDDVRKLASRARRLPSFEPAFRNLYLNQRFSPHSSLISRADWKACRGQFVIESGSAVGLSLDNGYVHDLCALVVGTVSGERSRIVPYFWKPEDYLREHSKRDFGSASDRYSDWAKDGTLLTAPGKSVNPRVVALKVIELCQIYDVRWLAYDPWKIENLRHVFDELEFPTYKDGEVKSGDEGEGLRIVPHGQGFASMTPSIAALELAVIERTLEHNGNMCLTWNMANAVATSDPAGNRKINKEKARFRIDGAVALTMFIGQKARDRKEPEMDLSDFLSNPVIAA